MIELGQAVRDGRIEDVRRLLDAGAEPNQTNFYGDTLIDMARDRGHDAISALLEQAPCSHRASAEGRCAARRPRRRHSSAAGVGRHRPRDGASRRGCDTHQRDAPNGRRPLSAAVEFGVEFLLARGAPANLPDDEPWATPLSWAERRGHAEVATILRRHGAR